MISPASGYNAVISCCEKGLQWQRALDFLAQMRCQEVAASVITYNAVISACGRCQEWQWALQIFDDMKMLRMRRNVITYNAMLSSCERNWQLALQLFLAGGVEYVSYFSNPKERMQNPLGGSMNIWVFGNSPKESHGKPHACYESLRSAINWGKRHHFAKSPYFQHYPTQSLDERPYHCSHLNGQVFSNINMENKLGFPEKLCVQSVK